MLTRLLEYNDQILHIFSFFFNDTATTEIYTLSLHDALPISDPLQRARDAKDGGNADRMGQDRGVRGTGALFADEAGHVLARSEEHTSELQSRLHLVCRLLLEKKKKKREYASGAYPATQCTEH